MSLPTCPTCVYAKGICKKTGVEIRTTTGYTYHTPKPITNADRIRSMTDEELAEWFYSGDLPWCNFEEDVVPCPYEEMPDPCEHCLLNWLKEEVRE